MRDEATSPAPPGASARRKAEERRARIVAAARRLFARQGFHNTGMAQIARESDVLVGQIYRDFTNKDDLIAAIVEADLPTLLDDPGLDAALASGDAARVREWIVALVARVPEEESRHLFSDIVSEAARNTRAATILTAAQHRLRERLGLALEALVPGADRAAGRDQLADYILTLSGAVLHRHVCGLTGNLDGVIAKLVALVDAEIDALRTGTA